jgi:hypothetical protein
MARPNLFIVGAPKCGTTAWVEYLGSHPEIFFSPMKEPHHFNHDMPGYRWVKEREDYLKLFGDSGSSKVVAEASVFYLYSEAAAESIRKFNPDAKILILVRDQEDYLPSLHNQIVANGDEIITDFEKAWRLSGERNRSNVGRFCRETKILDYRKLGEFTQQVERYFAVFPGEQIRVFHFRDWTADPRGTYQKILRFLDLADDGRTEFPPVNEAWHRPLNWLTPLLRKPPKVLVSAVQLLKRVTGIRRVGLIHAALRLNSRPGSKTHVSNELREEIRDYYADSNSSLRQYMWTGRAQEPNVRLKT